MCETQQAVNHELSAKMQSFVDKLNASSSSGTTIGENGHVQVGWSSRTIKENLTKLFFQLVRTKDDSSIRSNYRKLLRTTKTFCDSIHDYKMMEELFVLIGQTRDIVEGKGEYALSYVLLDEFSKVYPSLAVTMIRRFVDYNKVHPLGSWKDIKYFAGYIKEREQVDRDFSRGMRFMLADMFVEQLQKDEEAMKQNKPVSLAGKWLPSEKTKESWLFKLVAERKNGCIPISLGGRRKMYKDLRRVKSALNRYLDTTQVKMCGKTWADIDFNNVSSITMSRQRQSFMNTRGTTGIVRYQYDNDRIECASRFSEHIKGVKRGDETKKIRGVRASVYDLVKGALNAHTQEEKDVINAQWKEYMKNNKSGNTGFMIPMADTSASMECDNCTPLFHSIGLSIRASEMALEPFANRVLTFSSTPTWVDLTSCGSDFVEKVNVLRKCPWGLNTNFYAAMNLILEKAVETNMSPDLVEKLNLVVFSDMQIDMADKSRTKIMYDNIQTMFEDAGKQALHGIPYKVPHIIFWNLRTTNGFPLLTNTQNATMVSGYSATLLNHFLNKEVDDFISYTPEQMVCEILENKRYDLLREDFRQQIN